ncbi:hypothetical protein JTE90_000774 [Oedothorax gibbosus]|uniref:Uncharacterized protein n=1 Tax=Oedothorax gibbosus TaxID=931172 RepID=A0AAV6TLL3_9ARAC|nr:hypothetical protein JTE90_000774 [Oedothorax gibbosus]
MGKALLDNLVSRFDKLCQGQIIMQAVLFDPRFKILGFKDDAKSLDRAKNEIRGRLKSYYEARPSAPTISKPLLRQMGKVIGMNSMTRRRKVLGCAIRCPEP